MVATAPLSHRCTADRPARSTAHTPGPALSPVAMSVLRDMSKILGYSTQMTGVSSVHPGLHECGTMVSTAKVDPVHPPNTYTKYHQMVAQLQCLLPFK